MERTQQEIDTVIDKTFRAEDSGSAWPGMTYEQGVSNALRWVTGEEKKNPMDD